MIDQYDAESSAHRGKPHACYPLRQVRRIEDQLADHQTYDDPARVTQLAQAHEDASRRLRALYQEWEQAAGA